MQFVTSADNQMVTERLHCRAYNQHPMEVLYHRSLEIELSFGRDYSSFGEFIDRIEICPAVTRSCIVEFSQHEVVHMFAFDKTRDS